MPYNPRAMDLTRGPNRTVCLAAAVAPVAFGLLSIWLGQDANWDLRNYHFYNPYALLNGRLGYDIAPAHQPTFYNPIPDLPFYFLVTRLPPKLTGFVLGAFQGLNFILLLMIARRVLWPAPPAWRDGAAIVLATLGMFGAGALSELGTTFQDNMMSLFVLASLAGLLQRYRQLIEGTLGGALWIVLMLGVVSGLGVGLKLTNVVYAVGCCVALLTVPADFKRRFLLAFVFGLGVIAGMAVGGGYWWWVLWQNYGNPVFPYHNQIFQSPWAVPDDYVNKVFLPKSIVEALLYPFIFTIDPWRVAEVGFRDLRIPIAYALAFLALAAWPFRRAWAGRAPAARSDYHPANLVLAFSAVAYLAWLKMFSTYRYLVPLEMVVPLVILVLVDRLALPRWWARGLLGAIVVVSAVTLQPAKWGRASWSDEYFGVRAPPVADPNNTIVVMTGTEPMAYVIPFFPPQVMFLRIEGWFTGPSERPHEHDREMRRRIDRHAGPLYALFRARYEFDRTVKALAHYRLKLRQAECVTFKPHLDIVKNEVLAFCPLDRM